MKKIKLTQGKYALVSDIDYTYLNQWNWQYLNGYARRTVKLNGRRVSIAMHTIVAQRSGLVGKPEIDHRNRNGLDNRRCNLRPATRQQQVRNRGLRRDNRAKCVGVTWRERLKKWESRISYQGHYKYLGIFLTSREAALAYNKAALKYFGEYAYINPV